MNLLTLVLDAWARASGRWIKEVPPPQKIRRQDVLLDVPNYQQQTDYSCGPVAAYAVIRGLTKHAPDLDEFLEEVGPDSEEGTSRRQILRVLRRYRVKTKVSRHLKWGRLVKHVTKGGLVITSWDLEDYTHWVVLVGAGERRSFTGVVYVNSSSPELDACYSFEDVSSFMEGESKGVIWCSSSHPCGAHRRPPRRRAGDRDD